MTLKVVGSNPSIYPILYFFKKQKIKNLISIKELKKINTLNLKYFFQTSNLKTFLLSKPFLSYYNFFFYIKNFNNPFKNHNFILLFNKKKWHYNFNFISANKTLFFFTLGGIIRYLKLEKKCLRRSKKGFLIYLNVILSILKRFPSKGLTILLNFFDNKTFFFKKRLNKYEFSSTLLIKIPFANYNSSFKKHKSIKRRLTKKFLKRV